MKYKTTFPDLLYEKAFVFVISFSRGKSNNKPTGSFRAGSQALIDAYVIIQGENVTFPLRENIQYMRIYSIKYASLLPWNDVLAVCI